MILMRWLSWASYISMVDYIIMFSTTFCVKYHFFYSFIDQLVKKDYALAYHWCYF